MIVISALHLRVVATPSDIARSPDDEWQLAQGHSHSRHGHVRVFEIATSTFVRKKTEAVCRHTGFE
jgi:hypothetical protein